MKLQIASQLAVYALLELAGDPNRPLSVVEIAARFNVSTHHLAKVMHTLGRANLVHSIRGAGGGHQFCGNARRTTLLDVIQLFEDVASESANGERTGEGTEASYALGQVLNEIDAIARATLGSITLATMLDLMERHRKRNQATADDQTASSHYSI